MENITIKDKVFRPFLGEAEILVRIQELADAISRDYEGKTPLLLGVLNGAFMFASDLIRRITTPCEIQFIKVSSYVGTSTTGKVTQMIGISDEQIKGRDIIIIEDIIDTGLTMRNLLDSFQDKNIRSVRLCVLMTKPECRKVNLDIDYLGFSIPNKFIVGYGFDYDQLGRNYPDIYQLV